MVNNGSALLIVWVQQRAKTNHPTLRNFSIFFFNSVKALSIESFVFAPVKTTFPEAKINADLTCSNCLYTTPGKLSFRTTFLSSHNLPISILQPKSAFATIFVTWKSAILIFKDKVFWISLIERLAACSASD